ncbi:hypothetical protein NEOC65_000696 [Neochlamydia sp. AcF65]|nr:hypothetical protein [Neochlamydia sp. AcF65]MBS4169932.1 hypothetical protein [Neochlamydia sp. AcF95]
MRRILINDITFAFTKKLILKNLCHTIKNAFMRVYSFQSLLKLDQAKFPER